MWVENQLEEPVLRHHVDFVHRARGAGIPGWSDDGVVGGFGDGCAVGFCRCAFVALFVTFLIRLAARRRRSFQLSSHRLPPYLAQLIVMEHIPQPRPAPYQYPKETLCLAPAPFLHGRGSVPADPSADTYPIDDLPHERGQKHGQVDGAHAGVQEQRGQDRTVEVVRGVERDHGPVAPGEVAYRQGRGERGGKRGEEVEDCECSGDLHE